MYNFVYFVPQSHMESVRDAVLEAGAGRLGNYDSCCWYTKGIGQFRPLEGSNPFLGNKDEVEMAIEYRVECIVAEDRLDDVIKALKKAHPYEVPAYHYYKVELA